DSRALSIAMSNEDWRPRLTTIDDPIAEDHWSYATKDGETKVSRIVVGRPQPLPGEAERAWYCPLSIGGYLPGIKCVMGVGPVDALMNAMTLVRRFFEEHSDVTPRAGVPPRQDS
ncbi:MAG TPA: hypothetical protein VEZ71_15075, partial [Archangium sp.]|nr:hypothetical protein [Archangium sp.]